MTNKKEKELIKLLEELWLDCNNGAMYIPATNELSTTPNIPLRNKVVSFIESIGHKTTLEYIPPIQPLIC